MTRPSAQELMAYGEYCEAHREYANLVGGWFEILKTPRFRRAERRQRRAWERYQQLILDRKAVQ